MKTDNAELDQLVQRHPAELTPRQAFRLTKGLGNLARWLLAPEVLEKAVQVAAEGGSHRDQLKCWTRPLLPEGLGACWVLARRTCPEWRALREAFVIPLRWRRKNGPPAETEALPRGLREQARRVMTILKGSGERGIDENWSLGPAEDGLFDGPGPRFLEGEYASAWVPLAAGLLLAIDGGPPKREVWASGCWDGEKGIVSVEGLLEKLRIASEFGARQFFVPQASLAEAQAICREQDLALAVKPLKEACLRPREAMGEYLAALEVRANRNDSREARVRTYNHIANRDEAIEYYLECLVDDLADDVRAKAAAPEQLACRFLVTIASDSYELVCLSHLVFRPQCSLILYTSDDNPRYKEYAEKARDWLKARGFSPRVKQLTQSADLLGLVHQVRASLRELLAEGDSPEGLVVDVTPGKKTMGLAWAYAAPPESRIVYWDSEFDKVLRKPKLFTERPMIYRVKDLLAEERD